MRFIIALLSVLLILISTEGYSQSKDPKFVKQQRKSNRKSQKASKKSQKEFEKGKSKSSVQKSKKKKGVEGNPVVSDKTNSYVEKTLVGNPDVPENEKKSAYEINKNQKRTDRTARARSKNKVKQRRPPKRKH